jgi:hypothetical protein
MNEWIVCLIKTSSGSQKTELHDVKCYKVIIVKKFYITMQFRNC